MIMQITRKSLLSGIVRTLDIPVTEEQMQAWRGGVLIQRAMPNLSADDREFILTGITADEWDALMVGEDD
jgi:hypothetical protein